LKKLADERIVKFIFFTGCNKVNLLSGTNSLSHSGLYTTLGIQDISLDPTYNSICGFTEDEIEKYFHVHVKEIADKHQVNQSMIIKEMKYWYDGYSFTPESTLVYNPISLGRLSFALLCKGMQSSSFSNAN